MNIMDAVRSGKRFRKPGGTWIERAPSDLASPGMTNFRVRVPARRPGKETALEVHFYVEDFDLDTWETEPEVVQAKTPLELINDAVEMIRAALTQAVSGKAV